VRRGELELEPGARLAHARFELARELVVPAGEEQRDRADLRGVLLAIDVVDARRRAALDLVLEAGPFAARELPIAAASELEVLLDEVQRAPRRGGGVVRPEVARAVRLGAPHELRARPLVAEVEPEAQ